MKIKYSDSGASGIYFQLNARRGLKTLQFNKGKPRYFKTKQAALKSDDYWELQSEYETQAAAYERAPKIVCKPYGLRARRLNKGWVLGIELEHLGKTPLLRAEGKKDHHDIICALYNQLEEVGVIHRDLHECNIMSTRRGMKVIDFDPSLVDITDECDL